MTDRQNTRRSTNTKKLSGTMLIVTKAISTETYLKPKWKSELALTATKMSTTWSWSTTKPVWCINSTQTLYFRRQMIRLSTNLHRVPTKRARSRSSQKVETQLFDLKNTLRTSLSANMIHTRTPCQTKSLSARHQKNASATTVSGFELTCLLT